MVPMGAPIEVAAVKQLDVILKKLDGCAKLLAKAPSDPGL